MKQYQGLLKRIGSKDADVIVNSNANSSVGNVRVSGKISVVEIGDTVLRNVGCTQDIYDLLDPGKNAILYVHYHNFRSPVIIGVSYPAEGRGFAVPLISVIANTILSLFLYPIMAIVFGLLISGVAGNALGLVVMLAGIGLTLFNVVTLVIGYGQTVSATRGVRPA